MSDEEHEAELQAEVEAGGEAAFTLAQHVARMGASKFEMSVLICDELYEVIVQHKPVEPA